MVTYADLWPFKVFYGLLVLCLWYCLLFYNLAKYFNDILEGEDDLPLLKPDRVRVKSIANMTYNLTLYHSYLFIQYTNL